MTTQAHEIFAVHKPCFSSLDEANSAYTKAAHMLFGEFVRAA